ncbi:MAG: hypothetical protein KAJ62_06380 [Desulfobacteraceae bacterium]|nr:hypothetical protein [Desulfobacteraceae bacterium]
MSLSRKSAFTLASMMRVLTLATYLKQETWAAPVYYVFSNRNFYFFSNPDSRHIKEALYSQGSENKVAASVFSDDTDFKNIKGLQMQGKIVKVENKKDAVLRAMEYINKYKINYKKEDILEFFRKKYKARLYQFFPETVYYMDNSQKFGSREKLEL